MGKGSSPVPSLPTPFHHPFPHPFQGLCFFNSQSHVNKCLTFTYIRVYTCACILPQVLIPQAGSYGSNGSMPHNALSFFTLLHLSLIIIPSNNISPGLPLVFMPSVLAFVIIFFKYYHYYSSEVIPYLLTLAFPEAA